MQCEACEARFFAVVSLPKRKHRGRRRKSHTRGGGGQKRPRGPWPDEYAAAVAAKKATGDPEFAALNSRAQMTVISQERRERLEAEASERESQPRQRQRRGGSSSHRRKRPAESEPDEAEPAHVSAEESRRKRWAEQARRSGTCRCGRQLGHAEVELHFLTCDDCGAGLGEGDMAWSCVQCDRDLCESCGSAPEGGQ